MKRVRQSLYGMLLLSTLLSSAGSWASDWHVVTIQNPDGVGQGKLWRDFGQMCVLEPERAVFVKHAGQGRGLYRVDGAQHVVGNCPPGTLFLEVPATVEQWQNLAQIHRDIDANERRKMRELLESK